MQIQQDGVPSAAICVPPAPEPPPKTSVSPAAEAGNRVPQAIEPAAPDRLVATDGIVITSPGEPMNAQAVVPASVVRSSDAVEDAGTGLKRIGEGESVAKRPKKDEPQPSEPGPDTEGPEAYHEANLVWSCEQAFDEVELGIAREKELRSLMTHRVFEWVKAGSPETEGLGKPVSVRWVDVLKLEAIKSRIVARGFEEEKGDTDPFSPTAAPGMLRLLLALEVIEREEIISQGEDLGTRGWAICDVSTAFLHADREKPILVKAPREAVDLARKEGSIDHESGWMWLVKKSLYGLRDSPREWHAHLTELLLSLGWRMLKRDQCVFVRGSCRLMIHVDDFLATGKYTQLGEYLGELQSHLRLKTRIMRATEECTETYLGRQIRQVDGGFTISMGGSYGKKVLSLLGMESCKASESVAQPVPAPGDDVPLGVEETSVYRSATGVLMWLQQERVDLSVCSNLLACGMSKPTVGHMRLLKRVARYVKGHPEVRIALRRQDIPVLPAQGGFYLDTFTDSDWAGDGVSRQSRSGWGIFLCGIPVGCGTRRQQIVALSSGEAELYGLTVGASETIHVRETLAELVDCPLSDIPIRMYTDNNACRAMSVKVGPGRVKHVATRALWIQSYTRDKHQALGVHRVATAVNPADLLTKLCSSQVVNSLRGMFGIERE